MAPFNAPISRSAIGQPWPRRASDPWQGFSQYKWSYQCTM
jgi:hypothetical protein